MNQYKARAVKSGNKVFAQMYMDKKFNLYKDKVVEAAKELGVETPYEGPVRVVAKFYMGTRRKKDLSNAGKLEFDALNGIIYEDDSQICKIESEKLYDKDNPRVEIDIYKYTDAQWAGAT